MALPGDIAKENICLKFGKEYGIILLGKILRCVLHIIKIILLYKNLYIRGAEHVKNKITIIN